MKNTRFIGVIMQINNDKDDKMIVFLEENIKLLSENDEKRWAEVLTRLMQNYIESDNKQGVASLIKKLYGGAGTFNDLVLHKDGKPLIEENNQLEKLRHELYEECIKKIDK
jgi:hypothetical protein